MGKVIFITGSTGLLGSYLLRTLLSQEKDIKQVIALSRGKTQKEAEKRVLQMLKAQSPSGKIEGDLALLRVVRGDIAEEKMGLPNRVYNSLSKEVKVIYHSAALAEFKVPSAIIRKVNIDGTKNVLEFALKCQHMGNFDRVNHISTVAVAGDSDGTFYEKDMDIGQNFHNTYEESKFEAEKIAIQYRKEGIPITIFRPAIIAGDSKTGYTNNFKMFYQPLHLFSLELFREIPADEETEYSLVPVDYAASAIVTISFDKSVNSNSTYHIANPHYIKLVDLIDAASKYFGFRKPLLIKKKEACFKMFTPLQISLIEPFLPHFYYKAHFDISNTMSILDKINFKWPNPNEHFLKKLFNFCVISGFIKKRQK